MLIVREKMMRGMPMSQKSICPSMTSSFTPPLSKIPTLDISFFISYTHRESINGYNWKTMCQYMIRLKAWMYPLYVPLTLSGISLYAHIPRDRKHCLPHRAAWGKEQGWLAGRGRWEQSMVQNIFGVFMGKYGWGKDNKVKIQLRLEILNNFIQQALVCKGVS